MWLRFTPESDKLGICFAQVSLMLFDFFLHILTQFSNDFFFNQKLFTFTVKDLDCYLTFVSEHAHFLVATREKSAIIHIKP